MLSLLINLFFYFMKFKCVCSAICLFRHTRIDVFCIVCSFVMCVGCAIGDHIVDTYSSIGLITALHVESNAICSPYLVAVSDALAAQ